MIELDENVMSRPRTPVDATINLVDLLTRSTRSNFIKITRRFQNFFQAVHRGDA